MWDWEKTTQNTTQAHQCLMLGCISSAVEGTSIGGAYKGLTSCIFFCWAANLQNKSCAEADEQSTSAIRKKTKK